MRCDAVHRPPTHHLEFSEMLSDRLKPVHPIRRPALAPLTTKSTSREPPNCVRCALHGLRSTGNAGSPKKPCRANPVRARGRQCAGYVCTEVRFSALIRAARPPPPGPYPSHPALYPVPVSVKSLKEVYCPSPRRTSSIWVPILGDAILLSRRYVQAVHPCFLAVEVGLTRQHPQRCPS